jgi:hypothetical protein
MYAMDEHGRRIGAQADSSYDDGDFRMPLLAEAASVSELERAGGFAEGALQQTVEFYNRHAERSVDPLWHKHPKWVTPLAKPPFRLYDLSVRSAFCPAHTFGGLETTVRAEVLDAGGERIPGLYAAGRTTAGMPNAPYIASGVSIGDCSFFGRQAGGAARENTITSSPVIVEMSWCTLTISTPVAPRTISSSRGRPVATMWERICLSNARPLSPLVWPRTKPLPVPASAAGPPLPAGPGRGEISCRSAGVSTPWSRTTSSVPTRWAWMSRGPRPMNSC